MSGTGARLRRVGHKGADLIAPGNTFASFDAAVAAGVDMIEFDVLREERGEGLILAHDWVDAASRTPHFLEEALAYFDSESFAGIELDLDLKLPGYELRVLDALRDHGLLDRALISTQYEDSLALLRAAEPSVRLGWSVPKLRRDPFRSRATRLPALLALQVFRALLPGRAARAVRAGRCDAVMAHWRLVTPRLVRQVRAAGGELYVWTVDDLARLRALEALGVTGVITNDPGVAAGGRICATRDVMDHALVRSEGVTETLTAPASAPGSWERFESLYRSSRDDVYAYVMTLLRDPGAAEDVTALAFERAYRRRRTFDRRRGEERAWLFGIARNAALDELRRRGRVAALVTDPSDDAVDADKVDEGGEGDECEVSLRRTAVQAALAQLSGREREIVALKFHAGLTNAELARVLGVSESNAGTLLYRTMEKLRKACNAT